MLLIRQAKALDRAIDEAEGEDIELLEGLAEVIAAFLNARIKL